MIESLIAFVVVFVLAILRIPLAFSMGITGVVGIATVRGWSAASTSMVQVVYETGFAYTLSVIPLFVLMGNLVARAGLADELFQSAQMFLGRIRGGLAHATVLACAGFGAICGSSIATAATMAKVAYPPMRALGYRRSLAAGVVAAGGTLGIMIPPSTIMIIYGIITETNIGKLFAAGVLPGILTAIGLMVGITIQGRMDISAIPAIEERYSFVKKLQSLKSIWGTFLLAVVVLGGIYGGVFTATEGAGFGAFGAFLIALLRRRLSIRILLAVLIESARTGAMLFALLIGATLFANFVNFTSLPLGLKEYIISAHLSPLMVILAIMIIYILLGMIMEELTMILLTVPLFFPIVVGLGFDPVWFGVLIVLVAQIGLISPPVGINLFVVNGLLPDVSLREIYQGSWIFVAAMVCILFVLIKFPGISLWLPSLMD